MSTDSTEAPVLVAFGSNIDPEDNIRQALRLLDEKAGVLAVSGVYASAALDRPGHPRFMNGACRITAVCPARDLKFAVLREIERDLGRVRQADKYAPRTIDLDIALYGDRLIDEPDLRVPDPDIAGRPFLAVPLAELAPDHVVPGLGRSLRDLADACDVSSLDPMPEYSQRLKTQFQERLVP